MPKKDTDYLFLSARLRAMEGSLLSRARMDRMLDARDHAEALKVLAECGYDIPEEAAESDLDGLLDDQRERAFADLAALTPNGALIDAFRLKYDYHNAKVLLKAIALGVDADRLLLDAGTVPAADLKAAAYQGEYDALPDTLAAALREAADTLGATRDPQRCDFVLDRAYWAALRQLAEDSGSQTLQGYVSRLIDGANLRSAVRALRLGRDAAFLRGVLAQGGSVDPDAAAEAAFGGSLDSVYSAVLPKAAALAQAAVSGGSLTAFEKACDDALTEYLQQTRLIAFGDSVVVAYLAAKEAELTAVRVIMAGRYAGLDADTIRERLREAYV